MNHLNAERAFQLLFAQAVPTRQTLLSMNLRLTLRKRLDNVCASSSAGGKEQSLLNALVIYLCGFRCGAALRIVELTHAYPVCSLSLDLSFSPAARHVKSAPYRNLISRETARLALKYNAINKYV